jgi:tetratricopeptide (TPR) repeat protein
MCAYYSEGSRWLHALLARTGETATASLRAWALYHGALLAVGLDDTHQGRMKGEAALALARLLDDRRLIGYLSLALGAHFCCQGEVDQATTLRTEGLAIAQAIGDDWLVASLLLIRLYYPDFDNPVGGIAWALEMLPFIRGIGDRCLLGQWLNQLSYSILLGDEPMQAAPLLEEAQLLGQQVEDKRLMAESLKGLGLLAYVRGDDAQAAAYYHEMIDLAQQAGSLGRMTLAFLHLGRLAHRQGKTEAELGYYRQGLMLAKDLRHPAHVADCLTRMATLTEASVPPIDALEATRILGAAEANFGLGHLVYSVDDAVECHCAIAAARARLADPVFAAAWAEGQAMSLDEAITYGLAIGGPGAVAPRMSSRGTLDQPLTANREESHASSRIDH